MVSNLPGGRPGGKTRARYRILSLDGGGIRGVLSAVLLERLEAARPGLLAQVDLFAGTSTGGILALGLAAGLPPTVARNLYEVKGAQVFADSLLDDLKDIGNSVGAQYSNAGLKQALTEQFGDLTLGELPGRVVVSSFDLDNDPAQPGQLRTWKPKFFHNFPGPDSDAAERVVDVALRTSAAPTYFPTHQGYIDGGVAANNPGMCAVAQALDRRNGGQQLRNLALLSLGTGAYSQYLLAQDADWGWVQWARPIIEIMLSGNEGVADFQCACLLGERYHRLDPTLPSNYKLDDVGKVPALVAVAEAANLAPTLAWLDRAYLPAPRRRGGRRAADNAA